MAQNIFRAALIDPYQASAEGSPTPYLYGSALSRRTRLIFMGPR